MSKDIGLQADLGAAEARIYTLEQTIEQMTDDHLRAMKAAEEREVEWQKEKAEMLFKLATAQDEMEKELESITEKCKEARGLMDIGMEKEAYKVLDFAKELTQ